ALRAAIVDAARRLCPLGLSAGTSGNISVREGSSMLITPSATPYDTLRPEDIALMRLDGRDSSEGPLKPSSEWRFHRDILMARPEINAIVHAHPPYATALAMARKPIPPAHYMVAAFGGSDVRVGDYALFGSQALSESALAALRERTACLLANHGIITLGETLDKAMWRAVELEVLAQHYTLSLAHGGPVLLGEDQISEVLQSFAEYTAQKCM
ncbi:UNVERIFIED_CONTAM: hypothetical protein GTU68_026435, partial [Idotea baltica]|nr:hypothetical protein [Idotea baltica]